MPAALLEIALYALFFFAMALALLGKKVTQALLEPLILVLQAIPIIGNKLASPVQAVNAAVSRACEDAVKGIEAGIGKSWHLQARLFDWGLNELKRHAMTLLKIATPVGALLTLYYAIRSLVHGLHHSHTSDVARIKTLEKEYHGIDKELKKLEREFHGIDETGIHKRINSLDTRIETINKDTIPALRTRVAADEGAFAGLESWLGIKTGISTKTWSIALATTLLASVGLSGLRCSKFTNLLNKFGCGLGGLLDALLGLAISALALENVCTLLPIAEKAFGDVVGPVTHLLTEVPLGGCETPPQGWARLSVATGPLPPPQTLGTLAA